jgi:hypothetical protein
MPPKNPPGPPMTLFNMREQGIPGLRQVNNKYTDRYILACSKLRIVHKRG